MIDFNITFENNNHSIKYIGNSMRNGNLTKFMM